MGRKYHSSQLHAVHTMHKGGGTGTVMCRSISLALMTHLARLLSLPTSFLESGTPNSKTFKSHKTAVMIQDSIRNRLMEPTIGVKIVEPAENSFHDQDHHRLN
jgi:hypothetical protein